MCDFFVRALRVGTSQVKFWLHGKAPFYQHGNFRFGNDSCICSLWWKFYMKYRWSLYKNDFLFLTKSNIEHVALVAITETTILSSFSALLAICAGNSPIIGEFPAQWRGAMMFSLICAWINGWVNNREAGDLRRHRPHYDVTLMVFKWVAETTKWPHQWQPGDMSHYIS